MSSAQELIVAAQEHPPKPVITGLLNESEIAGLHGVPEVFKTTFCLQLAEALATGQPFLGVWQVPQPREVYFLETEMSIPALGSRLAKIYAAGRIPPTRLHFADTAQLRLFRRAAKLNDKFALLTDWVGEARADVVILDTCNPFFRGKESPNDETTAGSFFDLLEALPAPTKLFVRHNHKRKLEDADSDAAAKIRGSGQFSDVPDLLLELQRADKRTNEAVLSLSKFRHGSKPDDLTLWFDSGIFQLISIPPVVHILQTGPKSRAELLSSLETRFNLSQKSADTMISKLNPFLCHRMVGHSKFFEIDWEAAEGTDWAARSASLIGRGGVLQGCISSPLSLQPRTNIPSDQDSAVLTAGVPPHQVSEPSGEYEWLRRQGRLQ
jgi:hypothetical protein